MLLTLIAVLHDAVIHTTSPPGSVLVDVALLNVAFAAVIPLCVDLVAHVRAPDAVKAVLNLLLAAVASVVSQLIANGGLLVWRLAVLSLVVTFLTSLASYRGVWKPMGVSGTGGAIQRAVPGGIG